MEPVLRPTRPVMDIQPRGVAVPLGRPAVQPTRTVSTVPQSAAPVPAQPSQSPTPVSMPQPASSAPIPSVPGGQASPAAPVLPPKQRVPLGAVIIAVTVGIGLIALATFAFIKTQKDAKTSSGDSSTNIVTPEEVQATSQSIDDELKTLNDQQDFDSSAISDQSLGL